MTSAELIKSLREVDRHEGTYGLTEIAADRIEHAAQETAELRAALAESLKLQSHYATLLNGWDGGERRGFPDVEAWIARLREIGTLPKRA